MSSKLEMTINVKDDGNYVNIDIEGIIKSATDSESFKEAVDSVCGRGAEINVNILHSFAITSTIIGFLSKKVRRDKENIKLNVYDHRLHDLFKELNLIEVLNVTKHAS